MSGIRGAGASVAGLLDIYGGLTRTALEAYLPRQEPRAYLYDLVSDYPTRGGRMLRPTLCLATARLAGASIEQALPRAVHIELLHNAILIHDDIEDESEERRGRPTLHRLHGIPLALNAGDRLALLSLEPLLDGARRAPSPGLAELLHECLRMTRACAEGQAMELGWVRDNVVDLCAEDYLQMVLRKTCWPSTLYPLRLGAHAGAPQRFDPDALLRFGFFVGAAFQIQDDLLNLVGDAARYGKELGGDLREGKRTLMLIHLLQRAPRPDREAIVELLGLPGAERDASALEWLRKLMDHHGSLVYAREVAHGLAGAAEREFELLFAALPASPERDFVQELPAWVIART